jgi:large subunit ribosomal protein L35
LGVCPDPFIFAIHLIKSIIMPKMKTHSGAKKRFKVTGSGKIKHASANARHLMRKKTTKQKRHLRGGSMVDVSEQHRIERMLCI